MWRSKLVGRRPAIERRRRRDPDDHELREIVPGGRSNDLTQLILGVERDSSTVAPLFDERNEAVKWCCAKLIEVAHAAGCPVGICGQAPSDHPDFAAFLVTRGIDSISLTADSVIRTTRSVLEVEAAALPEAMKTLVSHAGASAPHGATSSQEPFTSPSLRADLEKEWLCPS